MILILRKFSFLASFLACACLFPNSAFSQGANLYTLAPSSTAQTSTATGSKKINQIASQAGRSNTVRIQLDVNALNSNVLKLPLPTGEVVTLTKDMAPPLQNNLWVGSGSKRDTFGLFLNENGRVNGKIHASGKIYVIDNIEGNLHTLGNVNFETLPPEHSQEHALPALAPQAATARPDDVRTISAVSGSSPVTIDVMLGYTELAVVKVADIRAKAIVELAAANKILSNSGLNISLRMVDIYQDDNLQISKAEDTQLITDMLQAFRTTPATISRRNQSGADIAILFAKVDSDCGVAHGLGRNESEAYAVVSITCLNGNSLAHEIGHLLGAGHEAGAGDGIFSYSHGYRWTYNNRCEATVMISSPRVCPNVVPFFSDPSNSFEGLYGSYVMGPASANNTRTLRERAPVVAAFRNGPGAPGTSGPNVADQTLFLMNTIQNLLAEDKRL